MIERLFPESVVTVEASPSMWDAPLFPEEASAIARAGLKRRREFAAGRACAREALARLGFAAVALPPALERLPRWPDGVVGSISHCDDFCAAVATSDDTIIGLGLDVERADPLDESVRPLVCADDELEEAQQATGRSAALAAALLFSAKEAVYKGCYPRTLERWDFGDVRIHLDRDGTFVAWPRDRTPLSGRWLFAGDWLFTGVTLR